MTTTDERYVNYLDSSASSWKRPEGPPRIWRVINGRKKKADGEIPKFCIQEVPKDLEDDVIEFMMSYLIFEEPIGVDQGLPDDSLGLRESRTVWRDTVRQGVSVVALTVNSDPFMKPVIAGANILNVITAKDEANSEFTMNFKSRGLRNLMEMMHRLTKESDVMNRYGVDKYLASGGLSVIPSMRGQGLGEELLRARDDIGLAYQIPVTKTVFTATASQIVASRVGFEVLVEKKYSELFDNEGNIAFPSITVEFIKVMGKRLY